MIRTICVVMVCLATMGMDWPTYRGNPQRSGSDGKPGPKSDKVLWNWKATDHFIASPIVSEGRLYLSGLGFVNAPTFFCLDTGAEAKERTVWFKKAPLLELPTVSSPALVGGQLIFGEGMHQTNGASLYGFEAKSATPLWQLKVDGNLVHLEGSPTVADGLIYLGGGAAGVLCVNPAKLKLDGKDIAASDVPKAIAARKAELQKKYEEARAKKDPFAVPPTDRDLPRAVPEIVWQAGKGKWHVDAPVAVVGGRVLAASAFLDKEKEGSRALYCLDAKTGKELWSADLGINPWGGPSVEGDTVVVTGSSIGYDPTVLDTAKGIVGAFSLETGKPKWRKTLPGGVVSCAALSKETAFITCTDGRVRAYSLEKGALKWTASTGTAYFAPPALAGDILYTADLKGTVHALDVRNGRPLWKHTLATPGMVYAGPVLAEGRLYVATCNIAGEHNGKATTVVCFGEK